MGSTPVQGRTFSGQRRVRLGDVTGSGRLRLDAIARYLQDIATDDAADAGFSDGWVLRRLTLRIAAFPGFRDSVDLATWCSGVAASAAERRTTIALGDAEAVDAVALWVFVGPDGRPVRLDRARFAVYGIPTDRRLSTRLRHGDPPAGAAAHRRPWPLRAADVDVLDHVNNAISLAALEDLLRVSGADTAAAPWWVEVEYRAPIERDDEPELVWTQEDGVIAGGLCCDGQARTTFRLGVPSVDGRRP